MATGVIVHANESWQIELLGPRDEDLVGQPAIEAVATIPELQCNPRGTIQNLWRVLHWGN